MRFIRRHMLITSKLAKIMCHMVDSNNIYILDLLRDGVGMVGGY